MYQKTLILLKPDCVQRKLTGQIITRFENAAFKIHALKFIQVDNKLAGLHYQEHQGKDFYPKLIDFITASPVVAMVIGGTNAISKVRLMAGNTEPNHANSGTIRGDFAHQAYDEDNEKSIKNIIHASANQADAKREINIWFTPSEIIEYISIDDWYTGLTKNKNIRKI